MVVKIGTFGNDLLIGSNSAASQPPRNGSGSERSDPLRDR
jgi:hypothetical protein